MSGSGTGTGSDAETLVAEAGGVRVEVRGRSLVEATSKALGRLAQRGVAGALNGRDASLWGPVAEPEARARLGWLDLPRTSRPLVPRLAQLREAVATDGLDHVVLAGMGGSSLAPEVITRSAGVELIVLDTTDPHRVRRAIGDRLGHSVVVVASKSGTTIETDSQRRAYRQAFRDADLSEAQVVRRFVAVTDPGSPLASLADEQQWAAVVLADETVGGRYSALSAFGLVPASLAGVEVTGLLDAATTLSNSLAAGDGRPADNPGLLLGALLGGAAEAGRDKLVLVDADEGLAGFGDWAEQLVAESTGKDGRGILPVVVPPAESWPGGTPPVPADGYLVRVGGGAGPDGVGVSGSLGAQFLLWEYATAVAGHLLGINPFDQPNVTESKDNTKALLDAADAGTLPTSGPTTEPALVDDAVEVYTEASDLRGCTSLAEVLDRLTRGVDPRGYLAVMAYLDPVGQQSAVRVREELARRTDRAVTFGWGPRFLHSTGQYHKGGPQVGSFLQVTGAVTDDLAVPGRTYTFGTLQAAQAAGDLRALAGRGRPVVRVHLRDRDDGLAQLLHAAG